MADPNASAGKVRPLPQTPRPGETNAVTVAEVRVKVMAGAAQKQRASGTNDRAASVPDCLDRIERGLQPVDRDHLEPFDPVFRRVRFRHQRA